MLQKKHLSLLRVCIFLPLKKGLKISPLMLSGGAPPPCWAPTPEGDEAKAPFFVLPRTARSKISILRAKVLNARPLNVKV